ncbi:MAG: C-GCAxxG-C-C family protein, partial [Proteobacteria bacterium]|nr:C-GCAxxG-C-C family protein [Bacteroidota bacterium]MBU1544896.1 C-GCAxxG-C-C family protein [Pseudomonadota bacterium]
MEDENFLWAGIPFMGGICGENKATCGAVSAAAVTLGLYHRTPLADKQKAKTARNLSRKQTGQLVKEFIDTFGHVTLSLVGGQCRFQRVYKILNDKKRHFKSYEAILPENGGSLQARITP